MRVDESGSGGGEVESGAGSDSKVVHQEFVKLVEGILKVLEDWPG